MVLNLCSLEGSWREVPVPPQDRERRRNALLFARIGVKALVLALWFYSIFCRYMSIMHFTPEEQEIPVRWLKLLCCQLPFHLSLVNILIFVSGKRTMVFS